MPLSPAHYVAYRATDYVALSSPPMTLRVDEPCEALDTLLVQLRQRTAAFITAWNPCSVSRTKEQNDRAQRFLLADLQQRGCVLINGEGRGRVGDWPPEKSVLAIGLDRASAEELGRRFGQNAIVFHEIGGPSRLMILVEMKFPGSLMDGPDMDPLDFIK